MSVLTFALIMTAIGLPLAFAARRVASDKLANAMIYAAGIGMGMSWKLLVFRDGGIIRTFVFILVGMGVALVLGGGLAPMKRGRE
ncbi:hypothetical protein [Jannaschia pohangensis]|uniref:Uncharacterized protein n=1 Tax=Jannaschia pohangensis TaxID=390807 RepID=A0A1I3NNS5_9RHOB|nr:hypothetical protein [Jannaschia pohangensis]SFJ10968.1 hypothetical protein SAMN04488095_2208 [Jannaschia pohangensis]